MFDWKKEYQFIRRNYPNPRRSIMQTTAEEYYCVVGAVCQRYAPETIGFPRPERAATVFAEIYQAETECVMTHTQILKFCKLLEKAMNMNDKGHFAIAWFCARRAMKKLGKLIEEDREETNPNGGKSHES
jgi:hypothetical protein